MIAWISLVLGPLALLVLFQLQFLPYHDPGITLWQRAAVFLDLAILWMLWPSIVRAEPPSFSWRDLRAGKAVAAGLASIVLLLLVLTIVTFPGEFFDGLPSVKFIPRKWTRLQTDQAESQSNLTSLHELLVAGSVDYVKRTTVSLWSNRLVLPSIDVIDHSKFDTEAKIAALPESVSLRGRRLEGAVLLSAHLRKADFTAAELQGALLSGADLREAKFDCEDGPPQRCTDLQGRSLELREAELRSLGGAQILRANLMETQMQGTNLRNAHIQEAKLIWAKLDGAFMWDVQLRGADLSYASLEGADMLRAQLEGANFQDASLIGANLRNSSLGQTNLKGSKLALADLRGSHCTATGKKKQDLHEVLYTCVKLNIALFGSALETTGEVLIEAGIPFPFCLTAVGDALSDSRHAVPGCRFYKRRRDP
jgi:uncharacterized protein YjbI with pentapeptide repeats